jgi:hypothetical protein
MEVAIGQETLFLLHLRALGFDYLICARQAAVRVSAAAHLNAGRDRI